MRAIGTLPHENQARRLAHYLTSQGIISSCEVSFNPSNGQMSYQIWIHDEDKIPQASVILAAFEQNPSDPKFETQVVEEPLPVVDEELPPAPPPHRFGTHLTTFLLSLCVFIFFLNTVQEIPLREEKPSQQTLLMTPIQAALLYDLPPDLEGHLQTLDKTPYWRGLYDWVVLKIKGADTSLGQGPLFSRIRQGEIWRLFTPCVLHYDLLHILFNMLWLWYLGRPIEQRIGPWRTLLLTLIAGIGSNTIQYLMSGPFFIGYSGIVTALAGFIWMRERIAPWEGYPLNRGTILFLLFFIGAIFVLQVVAFCIQIFTAHNFAPNIANTAHIAGALIGAALARSSYFAQRMKT